MIFCFTTRQYSVLLFLLLLLLLLLLVVVVVVNTFMHYECTSETNISRLHKLQLFCGHSVWHMKCYFPMIHVLYFFIIIIKSLMCKLS